jgi:oligosaccharide repeat unit polymerase
MRTADRAGVRGRGRVIPLRSVFSPLTLVVFLYTPLLLFYAISSKTVFATEFDSRKTLSWTGFAFFALALLCFAGGAKLGDDSARATKPLADGRPADRELTAQQRRSLTVLVEVALVVSIAAYLLWFAIGALRAGGLTALYDVWRSDPHLVKLELLSTIPGVTTLTQLAVAAIPLAVAFRLGGRGSVVRLLVVVVLVLATVRTVLNNERLALLELLIPIAFLLAAPRKVTVPRVVVYALTLLVATITFFAITELRRTYAYTGDFSTSRATTRFFGYYLTSVNNGMAVVDEYPARTPVHSTGEILWQLPGVGDLRVEHFPGLGTVSLRYADLFGIDADGFWAGAFADQGLDYEFNVLSTPGYLAADFGWAALVALFVLGLISGRLYGRTADSAFHRALYGVWLVGLFEFMRIIYFTDTRLFPAYLVFLGAYLVIRRPVRVRAPRATRPVAELPRPTG